MRLPSAFGQLLCVTIEHGYELTKNSCLLGPNYNVVWNLRERNSNKTPDPCSARPFSSGESLRWKLVHIWYHGSHGKPVSLPVPREIILQGFLHLCGAGGQPLPSLILQGNGVAGGPSSRVVGHFPRMFPFCHFSLFMTSVSFPGVIFLSNELGHFAPQKRVNTLGVPTQYFQWWFLTLLNIYLDDINVRFSGGSQRFGFCVVRK